MKEVMDVKHLTQFLLYTGSGKESLLLSFCISQTSTEKQNWERQRETERQTDKQIDRQREREIDYKELLYAVMETEMS